MKKPFLHEEFLAGITSAILVVVFGLAIFALQLLMQNHPFSTLNLGGIWVVIVLCSTVVVHNISGIHRHFSNVHGRKKIALMKEFERLNEEEACLFLRIKSCRANSAQISEEIYRG